MLPGALGPSWHHAGLRPTLTAQCQLAQHLLDFNPMKQNTPSPSNAGLFPFMFSQTKERFTSHFLLQQSKSECVFWYYALDLIQYTKSSFKSQIDMQPLKQILRVQVLFSIAYLGKTTPNISSKIHPYTQRSEDNNHIFIFARFFSLPLSRALYSQARLNPYLHLLLNSSFMV